MIGCPKIDISQIEDVISNITMKLSEETFSTLPNCSSTSITSLKFTYVHQVADKVPDLSKFINLTVVNFNQSPNIKDFNNLSYVNSLQILTLAGCDLHGRMINFTKLTNLTSLDLSNNTLWTEDLENLKALSNNKNLSLNLSYNSIIDASALLVLDTSCKIDLGNNVNLTQESKDALKARFGSNVRF